MYNYDNYICLIELYSHQPLEQPITTDYRTHASIASIKRSQGYLQKLIISGYRIKISVCSGTKQSLWLQCGIKGTSGVDRTPIDLINRTITNQQQAKGSLKASCSKNPAEAAFPSCQNRLAETILLKLISRCLQFNEPVLLVGDAGSGKTSVCEAISSFANQHLRSINLHRNSEVGELLRSRRPIRQRAQKIQTALQQLCICLADLQVELPITDGSSIDGVVSTSEKALAERMRSVTDSKSVDQAHAALNDLKRSTAPFDWSDGPLIQAMQERDHVLLDEISLADDSVLKRLNSLLKPERSIVLAERGGDTLENMQITAHLTFQIFANMNPGGDFGKRELSPAPRNRFTEIWVSLVSDPKDRFAIYCDRLSRKAKSST
ncbi:hypothetical protein PTTG_12676 [Puccinia triticina 1-1 BBBD Race 1]|uniref:AAA domain-containing protein n=1 Tax=Puccinia triticina (isolate 1-1 / race 1 (BBBD)) TaxID=630390 RepID=A0A180G5K5_PUCT1|nr:hypothetical protein PTTG_12676 [Puccinia triticina 1-1 BBBD Race 1]